MPFAASPLLTRLRRHRGVWVLVIAVLMIKLVSSSICIGDDPAATLAQAQTTEWTMAVAPSVADVSADQACLLGEAGSCHCACVHAATLAGHGMQVIFGLDGKNESSRFVPDHLPTMTGPLLRPPTA